MAAHKKVSIYFIRTKIATRRISSSLITNLRLELHNSKKPIQYGGWICKDLLYLVKNWHSEIFEVADYESSLRILELKKEAPM